MIMASKELKVKIKKKKKEIITKILHQEIPKIQQEKHHKKERVNFLNKINKKIIKKIIKKKIQKIQMKMKFAYNQKK